MVGIWEKRDDQGETTMSQWTREITQAMGFGERHSEPGLSGALAVSLAVMLQAPFTLFHADAALFEPGLAHMVSIFFFLAMAAFGGVACYRPAATFSYFCKPSCAVTWSLVSATVVACIPALQAAGMANEVVLALVGVVLGVGFFACYLFLAHLFTRTYIPDIVKRAFAGAAVAVLLEAIVMVRLSSPWSYLLCAALLALNTPLMLILLKNAPAIGDFVHFKAFCERPGDLRLFLAKVAMPVACTGVILRMFYAQSEHFSQTLPAPGILNDVTLLVCIAVAYVITCFAIYGVRSFGWPFAQFFSFLIPLVCLFGSVSISSNIASVAPYDGGVAMMVCVLLALTWSFMGGASLEYLLRSASVFGMGLASLAVGILLGGAMVHAGLLGTSLGSIVLALVCLAMAIGYLPARPAPNLTHSTYSTPLRSVTVPYDTASDEAAEAQPAEEAPAEQPEPTDKPQAPVKGRFMRRCDAVAKTFLLSARETEVLYLLAKGRSMNHIMEELVISEGTTKTHINHVYKKLNIHSRHELLDLIESMEVEDVELDS